MKALLAILFITLLALTGNPHMIVQKQTPATKSSVLTQNVYNDSLRLESEEKRKMYYVEVKKTENLTNQLIAKTENLEAVNMRLNAEIKRLKKVNEFLKQNIDTVYIHDTVFKKRKFLQLFKN